MNVQGCGDCLEFRKEYWVLRSPNPKPFNLLRDWQLKMSWGIHGMMCSCFCIWNYKVGERVSWNSIHLHCGTTIAVLYCAQGLSPGLYIVTSKLQVWSSLPGRQTHSCSWSSLSARLGWRCFLIPVDVRDGEEQKEFSHGPCPSLNAFEPALA